MINNVGKLQGLRAYIIYINISYDGYSHYNYYVHTDMIRVLQSERFLFNWRLNKYLMYILYKK